MTRTAIPLSTAWRLWGTVTDVVPGRVGLAGLGAFARIGQEIRIETASGAVFGEILSVSDVRATASLYTGGQTVRLSDKAFVEAEATIDAGDHLLGKIVNYRGEAFGDVALRAAGRVTPRALHSPAPLPHLRRSFGARLSTGLMLTDTVLPLCRGQRMGLFAGSGVGKSSLVAALASGIDADRIVISLVGERSREVNDFLNHSLSPAAREKAVIVAATASEPAGAKKRAAYCAMAIAEHFRDEGHHVLLLIDSITRFAEAHREMALLAGETPALNAFPPSTVRVISELAERAGPGAHGSGDITGVFSVLVAGSDFEEPVADMIRGILDGHILLTREIAERGRYPAIDVLKSVSRCLPKAASQEENALIADYKKLIALQAELAPMVRANLYQPGLDASADRALERYDALDAFAAEPNAASLSDAFAHLSKSLGLSA